MWAALQNHWPEYLMEAGELGLFMVSACVFATLLGHPASPVYQAIESEFMRRVLGGMAMGLTAIGLICSPWGRRSGAHLNPAVTLSFAILGKIAPWDAAFYALAHFLGGMAGVLLASALIGLPLSHTGVNFAVTAPGPDGPAIAFGAELLISFLMLTTILIVSNSRRFTRWTPFVAGTLVATFITFESPFSGMSMNPARTWGSAYWAREWTALWIYFAAPVTGMLAAGQVFRRIRGGHRIFCAKFHHHNSERCIFRCNYGALLTKTKE
jgi:aquaporin Z